MRATPFIAEFQRVQTYRDALVVRTIRNECRQYMTMDQRPIGYIKQFRFWRKLMGNHGWEAWIISAGGTPIGYGIISQRRNRTWVSGGLTHVSRGMGYGRTLFSFLTQRATRHGPDVYLNVLTTNEPAIATYHRLGYREIGRDERIITMVHP